MDYTKEQLQDMKRGDLQKLCKKFGIKANMKTDKMVEELVKHYSTTDEEEAKKTGLPECATNEVNVTEPVMTSEESKCDSKESENPTNTKELPVNPPVKRKSNIKIKKPVQKASKIPRLNGKPDTKTKNCKTPTNNTNGKTKTPKRTEPKDWAKIHQRQFDKMDSLDEYWSKKRKRAEDLGSGIKRVKTSTEEKPKAKVIERPTDVKSVPAKTLTSKVVTPKLKEEALSKKKRLTFNFFPSAKENAVQTPGAGKQRRTILYEVAPNKPVTPFRFTSNTMPFGSPTPRRKFDLQESLAKPLPYKPYTGKLRTPPYAKQTTKASAGKTSAIKSRQRDVKDVKTKMTRNDRRQKQVKAQGRARESVLSRRRGLVR